MDMKTANLIVEQMPCVVCQDANGAIFIIARFRNEADAQAFLAIKGDGHVIARQFYNNKLSLMVERLAA
jgi:hypothetical protein